MQASVANLTKVSRTPATPAHKLNACLFIVCSIGSDNKASLLKDFLTQENIYCTALMETWLRSGPRSAQQIGDITGPSYQFRHKPRANRKCGGVCVVNKSAIKVKSLAVAPVSSFEYLDVLLQSKNTTARIDHSLPPPIIIKESIVTRQLFLENLAHF